MKRNWYGFNHNKVNEKFEGNLTYLNDFCINSEYSPVAVYKVDNPNREKNHKDYLLLQTQSDKLLIRGMNSSEIDKFRFQDAIQCLNCDDIIYSVMRHDDRSCKCTSVSIDGGKDYTKVSFKEDSIYKTGTIDLLTNKFEPL